MPAFQRGSQDPDVLHLTLDRKVSPLGIYQPSRDRWIAKVPNSFGLPAGESCPGKTPFCTSCYAKANERSAGVAELVGRNFRMLQDAGSIEWMAALLAEVVGVYTAEADRIGLPPEQRMFRIHWDGDFFSTDYAQAWAQVITENPGVRFWAYTRSFRAPVDVTPFLVASRTWRSTCRSTTPTPRTLSCASPSTLGCSPRSARRTTRRPASS